MVLMDDQQRRRAADDRCRALLSTLLSPEDTADEAARRRAYRRCMDFAQEMREGKDAPLANLLLARAAQRLGQTRAHLSDLIPSLAPDPADGARLSLTYSDDAGPDLVGNADGLRYLSGLLSALADAAMLGEHVHLEPDEHPFAPDSYRLTVSLTGDEWFERRAAGDPEGEEKEERGGADDDAPVRREIEAGDIAALCFLLGTGARPLPPMLPLTPGRLYRVFGTHPLSPDGPACWKKYPAGLTEAAPRMVVFGLRDDDREPFEIALHLDDPDLHYFTRRDLEPLEVPR
jgi:hypothetical protein